MSSLVKASQGFSPYKNTFNTAGTGAIGSGSAYTIVSPAQNVNGITVHSFAITGAGGGNGTAVLIAHGGVPAADDQGDCIAFLAFNSSLPLAGGSTSVGVDIPKGYGFYIRGSLFSGGGKTGCVIYTLK